MVNHGCREPKYASFDGAQCLQLVRAWLSKQGFRLVSETLTVERDRLHLTIAAERGDDLEHYRHATLTRDDLRHAGPLLVRSGAPEAARHWLTERDRLLAIVEGGGSGPSLIRARAGFERAKRVLEVISPRGE